MTRAERQLFCTWAARRTFGNRTVSRQRSPYMEAVELACSALARGEASTTILGLVRTERDRLDSARSRSHFRRPSDAMAAQADPALLEALKLWRLNTARASGVPAYVIFHDTTLAAVATNMPSTAEELLDVPGLGPVKAARYGEALLELVLTSGPGGATNQP